MKRLLPIAFFLLASRTFAQGDVEALALRITEGRNTELEKVTAIFKWVTGNISYKVWPAGRAAVIGNLSRKLVQEPEIDDSPLKPLNERVAEAVLKRGTAVCDGYARLFASLCNYAGIRAEVIVGYARTGTNKPTKRFGVNHYWNAVQADGNWYLLDATWASGYITALGDQFIRDYDDRYFLTPPERFIQDHYPDDPRWTLLPDTKFPDEFLRSPFRHKSFTKYQITSYSPSTGIIEASMGDTIRLKLETPAFERNRNISPDLLIDSALFRHSPSWVFLQPSKKEGETGPTKLYYEYTVARPDVEWLYLLYNDDLVLRYKVNVSVAANRNLRKRKG